MNLTGFWRNQPKLLWMLAVLAVASQIAGALFARRFRRFEISGQSMMPTLSPGDWVLVDEHAYRTTLPRRGDIVVLSDPREPNRHLVKRITSVDLHGEVRVEGDNAEESTDSRHFGSVSARLLIGRVRWRYWPRTKIGAVPYPAANSPSTSASVGNASSGGAAGLK